MKIHLKVQSNLKSIFSLILKFWKYSLFHISGYTMKILIVFSILFRTILGFAIASSDKECTDCDGFSISLNEESCKCDFKVEYVCGDNGLTYDNKCKFFCAQDIMARKGKAISILHDGECEELYDTIVTYVLLDWM